MALPVDRGAEHALAEHALAWSSANSAELDPAIPREGISNYNTRVLALCCLNAALDTRVASWHALYLGPD